MRFARREGVPQPWRQRVQLCARPQGGYPAVGTPDYLPTQAVAVGCTRAHGLVTGDYTVTIRWQAQRQRARLPSEEMLTTEPACAVTPTHAPQRSTAQHSTALFQCHDCTAAPAALPPALRGCALAQHPTGAASHRIAWATGFHACRVAAAQPRKPTRADVLPVERCSLSRMRTRVGCTAADASGRGWPAGLGFNRANRQADEGELGAARCVLVGTWASSRRSSRRRTAL
jgi:hypothetical protein